MHRLPPTPGSTHARSEEQYPIPNRCTHLNWLAMTPFARGERQEVERAFNRPLEQVSSPSPRRRPPARCPALDAHRRGARAAVRRADGGCAQVFSVLERQPIASGSIAQVAPCPPPPAPRGAGGGTSGGAAAFICGWAGSRTLALVALQRFSEISHRPAAHRRCDHGLRDAPPVA
jgi:hypothetical protein